MYDFICFSSDSNVPFESWDSDRVSSWLHEIGLDMYVHEARRWIRNGEQLLNATQHDLEKVRTPVWSCLISSCLTILK